MAISSDGTWYHEGVMIKRPELWQLFAGILRRETDEEYYLVTPVEKCRVDVALHPLIITDVQLDEAVENAQLLAVLNAGGVFPVGPDYPLKLEENASGAAYIELPHGLSALCSRAQGRESVGQFNICSATGVFLKLERIIRSHGEHAAGIEDG